MKASMCFLEFRGVGETLQHLEHGGHIGRRGREDIMAVVLEVPRPCRGAQGSYPRVASVGVLEVFLSLLDDRLVVVLSDTKSVAVATQVAVFLLFSFNGVGVRGDDRDLAPIYGADAVGWEGKQRHLELGIRPWGRVRSDLIQVGSG